NFKEANKNIQFEKTPFFPTTVEMKWEPVKGVRRCGINNFGFSGTNCHVILEEYSVKKEFHPESHTELPLIFTISAKNKQVLKQLI
ncbi:ketoacyl-synthetase C-terminal extension domain-containing protein, partial [Paraburkholderia sp. SIMBA_027]